MEFKEEVYTSDGLYGYFFKFICDEFVKNMKEHPEINEFAKKNNVNIFARECFTADMISQEIDSHKGHIKRSDAKMALRNWRDKEQNSVLGIYTEWVLREGKMWVARITLQIRPATLCFEICVSIHDLELYKKHIAWAVKHEIGHVLDYINTRHGISLEEFNRICERDKNEYDKYYDESANVVGSSLEDRNKLNRRYYDIPQERDANKAIGITVDEMIAIDDEMFNKYHNKLTTLHISQSNIHDVPEEKKNEV